MKTTDGKAKPILLLGVGNILQRDDGIGVRAVEKLMEMDLPPLVEVIDGGIAGLDLLKIISDREVLIVIDAVDGGMKPGTIYRFTPEDLGGCSIRMDSLHQIGLLETLRMAELINGAPKQTVIIGVQPESIDWGLSPTKLLIEALPKVISIALDEMNNALNHPAITDYQTELTEGKSETI